MAIEKTNFTNGKKPGPSYPIFPNGNNTGNKSILNRFKIFSHQENLLFADPLREFFGRFQAVPYQPTIGELLSIEINAVKAVGLGSDLQMLKTCRRKILEFANQDAKTYYVDFLLSLGNTYFANKDHRSALDAISPIIVADRGNWHVLSFYALLLGLSGDIKSALVHFAEARVILEKYRTKFEVAEAEVWEKSVFEVRFRLPQALNDNPSISKEEIFKIIEPAFKNSRDHEETDELYFDSLKIMLNTLLEKKAPLGTLAHVFGVKVEREKGKERRIGDQEIGFISERLMVSLLEIGKIAEPKELFDAFNRIEKNLGKTALGLFAYLRIEEILCVEGLPGYEKAKGLREKVVRLLSKPINREIDKYMKEMAKALRQEEAEIRKKSKNEEEAKLQEVKLNEIVDLLGSPLQLEKAVCLAADLWRAGEEFRPKLKAVFAEALDREDIRSESFKIAKQINDLALNTATALAAGRYAPEFSLALLPDPVNFRFSNGPIVHDFFFVCLRDLETIKQLYRQVIGIPYAQPAGFKSDWFVKLADVSGNEKQMIRALKKALLDDNDNIVAELELARSLGMNQEWFEAEGRIRNILEKISDPLVNIRVATISIAILNSRVKEILKQNGPPKALKDKIQEYAADARKLFSQIEKDLQLVKTSAPEPEFIRADRRATLLSLSDIHYWNRDYEATLKYNEEILRSDPADLEALRNKGQSLFLLGKMEVAANFFGNIISSIINETGSPGGKLNTLYAYYAEALLHLGNYEAVKKTIGFRSGNIGYLLTWSRALARTGELEKAQEILAEVEALVKEEIVGKDPGMARHYQGWIKTAEGEVLGIKGERGKAVAALLSAINHFSGDRRFLFRELDARYRLIFSLANWAENDRADEKKNPGREYAFKTYEQCLREASELVEKYPFFPPGHEIIIVPLISLGRGAEALKHLRLLIDQDRDLQIEALANLIIMAEDAEDPARKEAQELLAYFEKKNTATFGEEKVRNLLADARRLIENAS